MAVRRLISLVFVVLLGFFGATWAKAAETPTLLVPGDLYGPKDWKKAATAKTFPVPIDNHQQVVAKIRENYYLMGDVVQREHPRIPDDWVSKRDSLSRELELGFPAWPKRPVIPVQLPLFSLPVVAYFKGEDAYIFHLNSAVTHWAARDFQRAIRSFDDALAITGSQDAKSLDVAVTELLYAFFCLQMQFEGVTLQAIGPHGDAISIEEKDFRTLARSFFGKALISLPREVYITEADRSVDGPIYRQLFGQPHFISKDYRLKDGTGAQPVLLRRNLDALLWLRTVVPLGLWNTEVIHRRPGGWNTAFDASEIIEVLDGYLEVVETAVAKESPIVPSDEVVSVRSSIRLWPRTLHHMVVIGKFVKALAMIEHRDPQEALIYADRMIRSADAEELVSLGFLLAGNVYFDMNNFAWARRTYAWCEAVSERVAGLVPTCLFFGAEAAFWEGRYTVAQSAQERFLQVVGDREFGPWAHQRLAEISLRNNEREQAFFAFERIQQLFPDHVVRNVALVYRHCLDILDENLTARNRFYGRKRVEGALSQVIGETEFQAKTCLLVSSFQDALEFTGSTPATIREDARLQLSYFDQYMTRYPDSRFRALFADRVGKLRVAFAIYLANTARCKELVDAYGEHARVLDNLGDAHKNILRSLQWGQAERKLVLRCAALLGDMEIWKRMRSGDVASDGRPLADLLYSFSRGNMKEAERVRLFRAIRPHLSLHDFDSLLVAVEKAGNGYVRDKDFWRGLGGILVARADLGGQLSDDVVLGAVRSQILPKPRMLDESHIACNWFLQQEGRLKAADWDRLARALPPEEWLRLLVKEEEQGADGVGVTCLSQVARRLYMASRSQPSSLLDERVLFPYLKIVGVKGAAEVWLEFAQRQEKLRRVPVDEVRQLYGRIAAESLDERVKKLAQLWLDQNAGRMKWP